MKPRLPMMERLNQPGGFDLMARLIGEAAPHYGLGGTTLDVGESEMIRIATEADRRTSAALTGNETADELRRVLNDSIQAALKDFFAAPRSKAAIN